MIPTPFAALDILLAEDNPDSAEALAQLLRNCGHTVRIASDGSTALAEAIDDPPDVLLLDIGLPLIDGWEIARRIRRDRHGNRCFIIAITGYDRPLDRMRSQHAGIHVHLAKPVAPAEIEALLTDYHPPAA